MIDYKNSNFKQNKLPWTLILTALTIILITVWGILFQLYQNKQNIHYSKAQTTQKQNIETSKELLDKSKTLTQDNNTNTQNSLEKTTNPLEENTNIQDSVLTEAQPSGCLLPADLPAIDNNTQTASPPFKEWLNSFKDEALSNHISSDTIALAFKNVHPIDKVIKLDRSQKEYSVTFSSYLRNSISKKRISLGKSILKKHHKTLKILEQKYGVQPQILVSLWAMESNFGKSMGNFSTISTLATLAYEGRRREFFQNELLCALKILEEGHIQAKQMKSSWAGAMGQPQFMPSTFFYYAADGNSDGKKDIWNNKSDVLASAANYLNQAGWKSGQGWGMEVKLPKYFDPYEARFSEEKLLDEWDKLGVTQANGKKLPIQNNIKGAIILPSGIKGQAFLVYHNFRVIREWNRSMHYALTVGHLSDRLVGKRSLIGNTPKNEKPLTRKQALTLQSNLKKLGFYTDKIDGMVGLNSKDAIREYQKSNGLVADGYPSPDVILHIKKNTNISSKLVEGI